MWLFNHRTVEEREEKKGKSSMLKAQTIKDKPEKSKKLSKL